MKLDRKSLNKKFDKYFEKPLLIMDFLVFLVIVIPFLIVLPQSILDLFHFFDFTIWVLIIMEVSFKLYAIDARWSYIKSNWEDVLVVLLPILPNLKVIKEVKILKSLRLIRAAAFIKRIYDKLKKMLLLGAVLYFHP